MEYVNNLTTLYENIRQDSNNDEHFVQLTILRVSDELFSPWALFVIYHE